MDVLSGFQGRGARVSLHDIAALLGLPGKLGFDGASGLGRVLAGRHRSASADYCETDVLNTYLIYLRFELLRGALTRAEHAAELARVKRCSATPASRTSANSCAPGPSLSQRRAARAAPRRRGPDRTVVGLTHEGAASCAAARPCSSRARCRATRPLPPHRRRRQHDEARAARGARALARARHAALRALRRLRRLRAAAPAPARAARAPRNASCATTSSASARANRARGCRRLQARMGLSPPRAPRRQVRAQEGPGAGGLSRARRALRRGPRRCEVLVPGAGALITAARRS